MKDADCFAQKVARVDGGVALRSGAFTRQPEGQIGQSLSADYADYTDSKELDWSKNS